MNLIDNLLAEVTSQEQQRVHDRMVLAAHIADALTAKGWSQKQLARKMGKRPSEVSKWLSGTHNFTIDTLSDLSQMLAVKLLCVK
jgi:ribosome-binding protein aMBF1 (putative translation factor)